MLKKPNDDDDRDYSSSKYGGMMGVVMQREDPPLILDKESLNCGKLLKKFIKGFSPLALLATIMLEAVAAVFSKI